MSESITCPRCGMTSHNPNDVREGYCGNCHDWTSPRHGVRDEFREELMEIFGVPEELRVKWRAIGSSP